MLKRGLVFLILFFLVIAGLIGYQWFLYKFSDEAKNPVQNDPLDYEISITHQENKLIIEQRIKNMEQNQFYYSLPKGVSEVTCTNLIDKSTCNLSSENDMNLIKAEGTSSILLTYEQMIDEQQTRLFENWFIKLLSNDFEPLRADIEVTLSEEVPTDISWVAGAQEEANIQREHLRYYAWKKKETTEFSIFMAPYTLIKDPKFEQITFYKHPDSNIDFDTDWVSKLPKNSGLTVIHSYEPQTYSAPLLVIGKVDFTKKDLEEHILTTFLLENKPPEESLKWMWSAFPSLILDYETGDGKARKMSQELLTIDKDIREQLFDWFLIESNKPITGEDIDSKLTSLLGLKTLYFSKNEIKSDPYVPLYFLDPRPIMVNNEKVDDWEVILRDQEMHFPLFKLTEKFGFKASEVSTGSYLLSKGSHQWRLYLNEDYFIYNEENYGITSTPLKKISEIVYIPEAFVENLLKIEVIKRNDGVYLRSLGTLD